VKQETEREQVEGGSIDPASGGRQEPDGEAGGSLRDDAIPIVASLTAAVLIVGLVLLIHPLRHAVANALSGDSAALRSDLHGVGGVVLILVLTLAHVVIMYPAEILDAAAGFVYGFWFGLPLMMLGWVLSGIVCHQIGRHAARPALIKIFGHDRFMSYERAIERGGVTLLLAMRMVPIVPFSLFGYVAGSARVPLPTFIWTTLVGYLPLTALFVYLGSRLEELSVNDPAVWLGAVGLIFFIFVTRRVMPIIRGSGEEPVPVPKPEPVPATEE
jgi:uncharacterized membrane protein YdjX (TVP38/TMEM64 family)